MITTTMAPNLMGMTGSEIIFIWYGQSQKMGKPNVGKV
jgi:hypothetical protein